MHGESTYCKYDAPHPQTTPSDWSSKDSDDKKAKAREQCPLLDFNLLEKQLQKTLRDQIQDVSQDILDNNMVEKDLTKYLQALTFKEDADMQNSADAQMAKSEVPENNNKAKKEEDETSMPAYKMTKQELQLQEEEEKYRVYMSTFGYGDNSDLDCEMDTESDSHAYPYLD